ncbi:MAG: thioredoxin fold domain-containing protein [Desulfobacteraceae bacterium]|nr:thioredoxin fold domain-containing protein [Desulfobacteraceae bacterium]
MPCPTLTMELARILLKSRFFSFALLLVSFLIVTGPANAATDVLTAKAQRSSIEISAGGMTEVALTVEIADNWHIHSNKPGESDFVAAGLHLADHRGMFALENILYPEAEKHDFAFSDTPVSVFNETFYLTATLVARNSVTPGTYDVPLELVFQACSESACAAPANVRVPVKIKVTGPSSGRNPEQQGLDAAVSGKTKKDPANSSAAIAGSGIFADIASAGLAVSLLLVFAGGLGLNLTPCVYPIIPITISYFGAQSEGRTFSLFILGLVYVLGMAMTYSAIGVISAFSGAFFGGLLQQPAVIGTIAGIFVFLALGMFGCYDFKLPDRWVARASGARTGVFGALLMGLTMGIIAAPCIGPFVLGLMAYVATVGDPFYGFLLFFFLSLGLGFPYLFLAVFAGKIRQLPRSGVWMEGVRHIFGLILLAMAVYFAAPLLPPILRAYALPVLGILACGYLLFFDRAGNSAVVFRRLKTGLAVLVLGFGLLGLIPPESAKDQWPAFTEPAFRQALANEGKVIMVFHADWCLPCREMDKQTFSDPRVQEAMDDFRVFEVDLTSAENRRARKTSRNFNVQGVPTVLIIDETGQEADRITGFIDPDEMIQRLSRVH